MTQRLISMSEKEIKRYEIIKNLIEGKINGTDASKQIMLSVRQIKRMKSGVIKYGVEALAHKNRGRVGNRKLNVETIARAEKFLLEKYYDFGPTFASEKLETNEGIKISKEKIRDIMINMGLWKPKLKKEVKGKKHNWRARKENFGEMQQFDGCYHIWFGKEETCLLLSVDDATGKITYAKFDLNESTRAVFTFWLEYFLKRGFPVSVYLDKFSTYKVNHKNAVHSPEMTTQFERAMNQFLVRPISAHSPQAKGRVERMFETLQDRLVKELRLAGITNIDDANDFLQKIFIPEFNEKFSVAPKRRKDLHRKNDLTEEQLSEILSVQNERTVNNDYTVMFKKSFFQLEREQTTTVYKKDKVTVEEHLDGSIKIRKKDKYLKYFVLPERPKKLIDVKIPALTLRKQSSYKPPIDHPWRKSFLLEKMKNKQKNIN